MEGYTKEDIWSKDLQSGRPSGENIPKRDIRGRDVCMYMYRRSTCGRGIVGKRIDTGKGNTEVEYTEEGHTSNIWMGIGTKDIRGTYGRGT